MNPAVTAVMSDADANQIGDIGDPPANAQFFVRRTVFVKRTNLVVVYHYSHIRLVLSHMRLSAAPRRGD